MKYSCPVCGYDGLEKPILPDNPPSEICSCCFFHFGYDDEDQGYSFQEWREKWIKEGMRWGGGYSNPPKDWDPIKQLKKKIYH